MSGRPPAGSYFPLPFSPYQDFLDDLVGPSSELDLTYTYAGGAFSCSWHAYAAHIYINLIIYYVGILCFLTRVIPQLKWTHAFLGRVYVSAMVLTIMSSLLVHTTGLPMFVLSSFVWCIFGMIFGWFIIKLHQNQLLNLALDMVDTWMQDGKVFGRLQEAVAEAKDQIAKSKTWAQRFVSYKAAHGILMTMSWMPIAGRFWATDVTPEFTCFSYPVYKAVNTTIGLTANRGYADVSLEDRVMPAERGMPIPPDFFPGGEVGWFLFAGLRALVVGTIVGIGFSVWAARRENPRPDDPRVLDEPVVSERSVQLVSGVAVTGAVAGA